MRQPTFQPALELLECRNAPGSLLAGAGATPLSLLGNPTPESAAKAQNPTGPAATQPIAVGSSAGVPSAVHTGTTTTSDRASGTGASLPPSLDESVGGSFADFIDLGATPDQGAGPAAPSISTTGGDGAVPQSNFSAGVPTGAAHSSELRNPGAPVADAAVNPDIQPPSPPSVTLTAPDFIGGNGAQVDVQAQANGANNTLNKEVDIDVDLRHDGSFTDPGDENYAVGQLNGNGAAVVNVPPLPAYGMYAMRRASPTRPATSASAIA